MIVATIDEAKIQIRNSKAMWLANEIAAGETGNKTFTYNTIYGSFSVYVAWNDNNTVTTCEVR
jgi:hypothetical protein